MLFVAIRASLRKFAFEGPDLVQFYSFFPQQSFD